MLKADFTGQFKKDYKIAIKRGCDLNEMKSEAITAGMNS